MARKSIKNELESANVTRPAAAPNTDGSSMPDHHHDDDLDDGDTASSEWSLEADDLEIDGVLSGMPPGREVYFTNSRSGLNLRSGPGTDFPIIRSLPFGTHVHLVKREGRWGLVDERGDGATDGFVHLSFLSEPTSSGAAMGVTLAADQVRAFWAQRNPRGARLYDRTGNALVDPKLLQASAAAVAQLESQSPNYRIEMYGPNGGLRDRGSTRNHTAQPSTGRGAAMDFVMIDRSTGNMLTNHPGSDHQHQGTVGDNAPLYQSFFNEVVRQGSKLSSSFAEMARFGGYFKGSNPMDTMHIDMRGREVGMAGGSLRGGFTREQMRTWKIRENRPYV